MSSLQVDISSKGDALSRGCLFAFGSNGKLESLGSYWWWWCVNSGVTFVYEEELSILLSLGSWQAWLNISYGPTKSRASIPWWIGKRTRILRIESSSFTAVTMVGNWEGYLVVYVLLIEESRWLSIEDWCWWLMDERGGGCCCCCWVRGRKRKEESCVVWHLLSCHQTPHLVLLLPLMALY